MLPTKRRSPSSECPNERIPVTTPSTPGVPGEIARGAAILLDMDGTLVDSEVSVVASWNRLFRELGSQEQFDHRFHGQPARNVLRLVCGDVPDERIAELHHQVEAYEITSAESVAVIPGTRELLGELEDASREAGRDVWTIATSCTRPLFEARYGPQNLPVPATTVTADQVTRGKPDPEPYSVAAERLGVDPAECIVVEDSVGGLRAGRAAGCTTIGVLTTAPREVLEEHADIIVDSIADLEAHLDGGQLTLSRRDWAEQ